MRRLLLGVLIVAAVGATAAEPQQVAPPKPATVPPRADAAISGVVTDGAAKQPIEDAIVELRRPGERGANAFSRLQFTDGKGRFVFTGLEAGAYSVSSRKSGYFGNVAGATGDEDWAGATIALSDGQWSQSGNVTLWPPASISGTVVDERGEPVIGVFVRALMPIHLAGVDQWAVGQVTVTDDRGVYRIGQLHAGRYIVMIPCAQASLPASSSSASLVGLGQSELAAFQAGERPPMATRPALVDVNENTRLLLQGYPVPPPSSGGRSLTYPITFAGSTSLAQATPVAVRPGDDRTGVDVRLEPVPAVRVSGVVEGPSDGRANLAMRLISTGLEDLGWGGEAATTVTGPDGSFEFAHVPAGQYTVEAPIALSQYTIGNMGIFYVPDLPRPPGPPVGGGRIGGPVDGMPGVGFTAASAMTPQFVRRQITVGAQDQFGITVALQPTIRMSGRLIGEADPRRPEPPAPPRFVELQSAGASPRLGNPKSVYTRLVQPGEFAIEGILPGLYVLRTTEDQWMVKTVTVGGRDVTEAPIDVSSAGSLADVVVTFTNAIPALFGAVSGESGAPARDAAVIAFPAEPERWTNYGLNPVRIRSVQTSTDGSFRFRNLPAGNYYVIAVPASRKNAWREPEFFKQAQSLATRITFGWGEEKAVDLKVSNVR